MKDAISWFEIPSTNLDKSQAFYETILSCKMRREAMGPSQGAIFPYDHALDGVGGAVLCGPTAPPRATGGVLIYLDCGTASIDTMLQRVSAAGGVIAMPRQALPPGMGFIAHIDDPEGNRIGLHSLT
jgi:uncharacterized protein